MNELQKFTSGLTIGNGATREKNLYKLQVMLCPQLHVGKNVDDVKIELQKNMLMFSTTTDEDFLDLLKVASSIYIQEIKWGNKPIFNADFVLNCDRLMKYLRKYNIHSYEELDLWIDENWKEEKDQWFPRHKQDTIDNIIDHYYREKPVYFGEGGERIDYDKYADYLGDILTATPLKIYLGEIEV